MNSFHLPGYYWYVKGEIPITTQVDIDTIIPICTDVLYSSFRRLGFDEFSSEVLARIPKANRTKGSLGKIKYFYNRQLLYQLTSKPIPTTDQYITVPRKREPAGEVQMDILAIQKYYRDVNYNIKYLVVIVDIYSRFVWCAPVGQLKVGKVLSAITYAFSRPGIAVQVFEYIQNKVQRVVIDGGSEFKKDFPMKMTQLFPNSTVHITPPKNTTFNRPTLSGPIESAIRMLRKILRDYALQRNTNILATSAEHEQQAQAGLNAILDSYNSMKRSILQNKSPIDVAEHMIGGQDQDVDKLTQHMKTQRDKQVQKKYHFQNNEFPIITSKTQGYGYRLYIQPNGFPKEVDFRMSLQLYYIHNYDSQNVILLDWETNESKRSVWQQLVLVKAPVIPGSEQINRFIKKEEKIWGFKKPAPKEVVKPYQITPAIAAAVDPEAKLPHPGNAPTRKSPRLK